MTSGFINDAGEYVKTVKKKKDMAQFDRMVDAFIDIIEPEIRFLDGVENVECYLHPFNSLNKTLSLEIKSTNENISFSKLTVLLSLYNKMMLCVFEEDGDVSCEAIYTEGLISAYVCQRTRSAADENVHVVVEDFVKKNISFLNNIIEKAGLECFIEEQNYTKESLLGVRRKILKICHPDIRDEDDTEDTIRMMEVLSQEVNSAIDRLIAGKERDNN